MLIRLFAAWARRRTGCPWLEPALGAIAREQALIARAARSVVTTGTPESLEDLLCRAERMEERLAVLCECAATLAVSRALQGQAGSRDDPGLAA